MQNCGRSVHTYIHTHTHFQMNWDQKKKARGNSNPERQKDPNFPYSREIVPVSVHHNTVQNFTDIDIMLILTSVLCVYAYIHIVCTQSTCITITIIATTVNY